MKINDTIYYLSGGDETPLELLEPRLGVLLHWGQETNLTMMDNYFIPVLVLVALVCDKVSGQVVSVPAERVMTKESSYLSNVKEIIKQYKEENEEGYGNEQG